MRMSQKKHGLLLIAEGAAAYLATLTKVGRAEQDAGQGAAAAAAQLTGLEKAASGAAKSLQETGEAAKRAEKIASLGTHLANQNKELAILQRELSAAAKKYGEASVQAQRKQLAIDKLTASAKTTEAAIKQLGNEAKRSGEGFNVFREIATGAMREIGDNAVDMALQGAQAIAGFVASSVTGAGDFEANMNVFGSVVGSALGESGKSLEDFSSLFISLGKELPVSTAEVQQAAIELAKGGIDPATISAGALRTSLDLAAAGGIGLADSATIMAKQLGVWVDATADAGTKSAFLAETANLLSQSANATTSDVSDLAVGLANAGGTAKVAGLSFRETVTGLSLLAPGFSSASDAGTSFKTMIARLIPSTKPAISAMKDLGLYTKETGSVFYDSQGSFIGLRAAAEKLKTATEGLSEAQKIQAFQTIFGQDAIRAAAILSEQGAAGYDRMTAALAAAGTVQEQARARQQGFNTALDNAGGSVEALQLAIGALLLPSLTSLLNTGIAPAINGVTDFVTALGDSSTTVGLIASALQTGFVPAVAGATAALVAYAIAQNAAALSFATLVPRIAAATTAFIAQAGAVAAAAWPYAAIAAAIAGVTWAYQDFYSKIDTATGALLNSRSWWTDAAETLDRYKASSDTVKEAVGAKADALEFERAKIEEETKALAVSEAAHSIDAAGRQKALNSINAHVANLQYLTGAINEDINAQARLTAATMTGTTALASMQSGLSSMAPTIALTEKEIEELGKAIEKNFKDGAAALGAYVQTEASFLTETQTRRADHETKMAALVKDKEAAKTQAQKDEIQQRIDAELGGYADQEAAAAESYARQQAAQNAHLGQMLVDYVVAQSNLGNIAKDKAAELVDGITEKFDIQGDSVAGTYIRMTSSIDAFAQSSQGSAQQVVSSLVAQRDAAVETQSAMDAASKDYVTTVTAEFIETGDYDTYIAKLHQLPEVTGQAANDAKAAYVANSADFEMLGSTSADYIATGIASGTSKITSSAMVAGASATDAWAAGIANGTPAVEAAAGAAAVSTGAAYVANSADFEMLASTSAIYLATGIASQTGTATEAGKTLGTNVAAGFAQGAANAPQAGTDAGTEINSGLQGVSGTIQGTASQMGNTATEGFASGSVGAQAAGATTGTNIATGISSTTNAVQTAGKSSGESAVQGAASGIVGAPAVGQNFSSGFAQGISAGTPAIQAAARGAAQSALNAAQIQLDSHSPSRKGAELGRTYPEGLAVGITEAAPVAVKAAADTAMSVAKAGAKLLELQQASNTKLLDIQRTAGEKLLALDAKLAADHKKAYADLLKDIRSAQADTDFEFSSNDLDQFEAETEEQKNQFKIREEAERSYQRRMEGARAEARQASANGDAELARDILAAKEKEAQSLLELDQKYMQLRASVDAEQLPALEKEYAEATEELRARTSTEVGIAQDASRQRTEAVSEEQAQIVSEARQASAEVMTEAQKQADAVSGATDAMVSAATSGWDAVVAAADSGTEAIERYSAAVRNAPSPPSSGGGGSPPTSSTQSGAGGTWMAGKGVARHIAGVSARAGGGGTFMANKPMKVLVGEAGPEMIHVSPLFRGGTTRAGSGWAKMAGGGTGIAGAGGPRYMGGSGFDLSGIDPSNLDAALSQLEQIVKIIDAYARKNKLDTGIADKFAVTTKLVADTLATLKSLRTTMAGTGDPIDLSKLEPMIRDVVNVASMFAYEIGSKKLNLGLLKEYVEAVGSVVDIMSGILDIREKLANISAGPAPLDAVRQLAAEARTLTRIVQEELLKLYEEERDALAASAEALEQTNSIYTSVIDMRKAFKDPGPSLMLERLQQVAAEAQMVVAVLQDSLVPTTAAEQEALSSFASEVESVASIFGAILDLREGMQNVQSPLSPAQMQALRVDTGRVADIAAELVPEGWVLNENLEAYAGIIEQATGALQTMIDLRASMKDLAPPVDVRDLAQLAAELNRLVMYFQSSIIPYAEEMVAKILTYGEVAQTALDALSQMVDLRGAVADLGAPIPVRVLEQLAAELRYAVMYFWSSVIPYAQEFVEAVERYGTVAQTAIDSLANYAALSADFPTVAPIPMDKVRMLVTSMRDVVRVFATDLKDYPQQLVERIERYGTVLGTAIDSLNAGAELGAKLNLASPIPIEKVRWLATDLTSVATIWKGFILPWAKDCAEDSEAYSGIIGNAIDSITGAATLGTTLRSFTPISMDFVLRAANDAKRIAEAFRSQLIPATEAQATEADRAAGIIGSSVAAINDVLSLGGTALQDYTGPSDEILDLAFADADRLMQRLNQLAAKYETSGAQAAAALADAIGGTATALKDLKEMALSLNPGANFTMDMGQLANFEYSASRLIETAGRLGAMASTLSMTGIGALPIIAESMNALFASLGTGGALFGGTGGTLNLTPQPQTVTPPMSAQQIYHYYNDYSQNSVSIGIQGVTLAQVEAVVERAMTASGRTAYTRQRMG